MKRPARFVDRDRHVEVSRGVGLGEQGEPIDGLARAVAQVEAVPRQSNEQIGAGVAGGAHAVRLRITAIGDGDVARLDAHAIQRFAFVERGNGEIGDPLAGDIVAQMQPKAGFAGSLDTRAVDEADPIFVRPPARRRIAARQQIFAERDQPIAAAAKPHEQGDVGNIDDPAGRGFRGQLAQRPPAGRIGQDQAKQIGGALDVTGAMKRAVPARQGLDRLGAAEAIDKGGERLRFGRIRRGKQLHSTLESR